MEEAPKPIKRLSDLLSEKDKAKVAEWTKKKLNPEHETEIPPELFTIAEAVYYGGWEAFRDIKRGYIESKDPVTGRPIDVPITLEEVVMINKACDKVWYKKLCEYGNMATIANISGMSKRPDKVFNANIEKFMENVNGK